MSRMSNRFVRFGSAASALILAQTALATDRHVPSQYATIQQAVDAAAEGDRIVLANGTYTGAGNRNVDFGFRNISVTSASGNPANCIIDLQDQGRALYIVRNQDHRTVISGITFRNGNAFVTNTNQGGAIFLGYHGATCCIVTNCVFENCRADKGGGLAVYTNGSDPVVSNCVFRNNRAVAYGGGMHSDSNASPFVVNCIFDGNANTGGFGPGGGLAIFGGDAIVRNCTFTRNEAVYGSALNLEFNNATVSNCIFWDNINSAVQQDTGTVTYCNIGGSGLTSTPDANGNFNANPLFVNAGAGNYRLQAGSPCIDRGSAVGISVPPFPGIVAPLDFDRNARICGNGVDLGVFESGACVPIVPDDSCNIASTLPDGTYTRSLAGTQRDGSASCQPAGATGDLWFRYLPRCTTTLNLSTCGSSFDTVLTLYRGNCANLTEVACNDNGGVASGCTSQPTSSAITASVIEGVTYFIRVGGNGAANGDFTLRIESDTAACPILNGSFEFGTTLGTLPVGSTNIRGWTVTRGGIDWTSIWQASDGSRCVDLQGLNSSGGVQQTAITIPGHPYVLRFSLSGNPDNGSAIKRMVARAGSTSAEFEFNTTGRDGTDMGWVERSISFNATSTQTEIEFYSNDAPSSWGAVVDNVRLIDASCRADFNINGVVDSTDFFEFLSAFFAANSAADFNNSGSVDSADFFAFLAAFFTGC